MQLVCRIAQNQLRMQGLKRLSTPLPKLERNYLFVCQFFSDKSESFCILGEYNSGWDSSE